MSRVPDPSSEIYGYILLGKEGGGKKEIKVV
jgi:hypothetical protein